MNARRRSPGFVRIVRLVLRLFPAEFRGDFGRDMEADLADAYRDASREGARAAAALWLRTLPSLIRTGLAQHLDGFARDVWFALRLMARSPAFTAVAILMIALGTGANAAMFSVVDALLLRSPFADPARLVQIGIEGTNHRTTMAITRVQYDALREHGSAFEGIASLGSSRTSTLSGAGDPQRFEAECVTASAFRVLGTPPLAGRTFSDEEERAGAAVAVISYRFWHRVMGGTPDALGREISLNDIRTTVIGIMPPGFSGPYSRDNTDGWLPIALPPAIEAPPARRSGPPRLVNEAHLPTCVPQGTLNVFARLKPAMTLGTAGRQTTEASGIERLPDWRGKAGGRVVLETLENINVSELRTPLLALVGAVGFVLLIACANVANLQLERAVGRRRELAIRMAIGATRGRVLRQTLTETLLLYLIGAALGAAAAIWTMHLIVALLPLGLPHVDDVAVNGRVLAATLALSCTAGLAVGFAPALTSTSAAAVGDLKISSRVASGSGAWIRGALVVLQVALSLTLMVGAGLMLRTFLTLRPVRPGFTAGDKITAVVRERSPVDVPPVIFFRRLFDRFAAIPGAEAVSGSTYLPMSGFVTSGTVSTGDTTLNPWQGDVTPNYFAEMQIPIVRGRTFVEADGAAAPPVAVVNETFARRAWGDHDPIGATIVTGVRGAAPVTRHVVGVVAVTRSLGADVTARPELYLPFAQNPGALLNVILRTQDPSDIRLPAELRAAAAGLDPLQVVDRITPLQAMLNASVSTPRFGAWLLGAFAAMALLLAAVGLAASIAWWVAQRSAEIGVRMALGAGAHDVVAMFLKQGLVLTLAGIALGLAGAALSTRFLQSWLYGVTPLDPSTFAACAAGMLAVAAAASYVPSRRAARVDPLIALRSE